MFQTLAQENNSIWADFPQLFLSKCSFPYLRFPALSNIEITKKKYLILFGNRWQDLAEFRMEFFCFIFCIKSQGVCIDDCYMLCIGQMKAKGHETFIDASWTSWHVSNNRGLDIKTNVVDVSVFFIFSFAQKVQAPPYSVNCPSSSRLSH